MDSEGYSGFLVDLDGFLVGFNRFCWILVDLYPIFSRCLMDPGFFFLILGGF